MKDKYRDDKQAQEEELLMRSQYQTKKIRQEPPISGVRKTWQASDGARALEAILCGKDDWRGVHYGAALCTWALSGTAGRWQVFIFQG